MLYYYNQIKDFIIFIINFELDENDQYILLL